MNSKKGKLKENTMKSHELAELLLVQKNVDLGIQDELGYIHSISVIDFIPLKCEGWIRITNDKSNNYYADYWREKTGEELETNSMKTPIRGQRRNVIKIEEATNIDCEKFLKDIDKEIDKNG